MQRRKLTKTDRQEVYDKCNGHCAYCGCEITLKEMQVDHIVPIARCFDYYCEQRKPEELDIMSNYLPACRSCNHYKSSLTLEHFRMCVERFPSVLMRDSVTYKNAVRFGLVEPKPQPITFYFEKLGIKVKE